MRRSQTAAMLLLLFLESALTAAVPSPTPALPPAVKAKAHGISLSGRVTRVDAAKKTFAVRDGAGKETALSFTGATKVAGGELKAGETVTVRYLDKDAKHIATYIRVNGPAAAAPVAATPGTPARASATALPGQSR